MMERLREGVNSIAVKIILGLIILSFVFAGVGSYITGGSNAAAKVGNVEISRAEFEQAYQNERSRMQSQMGEYFTTLLSDPTYVASFRQSVIDRLVNDLVIEQHAETLGLRISDAQVRSIIVGMTEFQNNGVFDQDIYQSALRRAGFTPDLFAEYMRRDLLRQQLLTALQGTDFTLPSEVSQLAALVSQTRDVRTIEIDIDNFADTLELTDSQISDYYQANSSKYTRPEQYRVSYLELSAEKLKEQVDVTEADAKYYYEENIARYSTEPQRQVSHILVQGDDQAKAQAILDELNAGADFATLAIEKSDDFGSAEEGGSLGWIEKDVMDPAFEEAAFALANVGDISEVVKSDFGYHVIRLDDVKAPESKPFADVSVEILAELKDQQAVNEFYSLQTELETVAFEYPDSLDDAAEAIGQEYVTTDFISQTDAPALLTSATVFQALQSMEVKEEGLNSEVLEIAPEHVIVVRIEDVREQTVLPLEEVNEQVQSDLAQVEGLAQAQTLADELIAGLEAGNENIVDEKQVVFSEINTIDRGDELANAVFALPKAQPDSKQYVQTRNSVGDIVIVELLQVNDVINTEFDAQIESQLQRTSNQADFAGLILSLREQADIEYYLAGAE